MRRMIVAANWKMHKTVGEAVAFARDFLAGAEGQDGVEVVLCPPFTALADVGRVLGDGAVALGAQDLFWEPEGPYTGAVSPLMLRDVGCRYVIVGHSERRQYFGETDATVNRKVLAALAQGLTPIICVGERLDEREAGVTMDVIGHQVEAALAGLTPAQVAQLVVAYEPVWAIGTGRTASEADAQEAARFLRQVVARLAGEEAAGSVRIQYGGSVTPANALGLMSQPDIDGALVGGASLKVESFRSIVAAARQGAAAKRGKGEG
ncbi:MAG: triose-phosphate isomerase [Firmicutes bacterium]|nr:triose-phosphate isomerase [Bacillota bacterium]